MKISLIWERTPTSLKRWLEICGLVLFFATVGLIFIYADTLVRAMTLASSWPLGAVQGIIAGLYDAVSNAQTFALSGPSPAERLVGDLQAWGWWPPTMDFHASHPDEMQRLSAHHLVVADELNRRGARAGIGFWVWAMSDGAVRTVSTSVLAIALIVLSNIVTDGVRRALSSAGGASTKANANRTRVS